MQKDMDAGQAQTESRSYLMPNEVAAMLRVTPATVQRWARNGELPSVATPGGHRRYLRPSVVAFARKRGLRLSTPAGDSIRILIVDDDVQISRYLTRRLQSLPVPCESEVANSGYDAGHKVATFLPDIVLLDLFMAGLDGFEVCRLLKEDPATRDIRVIAMTGHHTPDTVERILELGAETCLAKPLDKVALMAALGF